MMSYFIHKAKNLRIAIWLCLFIITMLLLFSIQPLSAGSYLKIDKIDAQTDFPNVKMDITISNGGQVSLSGLREDNISVYEDEFRINSINLKGNIEEKEIVYFVLSLDSSKSICRKQLARIKKIAKEIIRSAGADDLFAVYRFNDEVKKLNGFTNNRSEIMKNIDRIERHGKKTQLFNSIYDSIDLLSKIENSKKAIIVLTDGFDEGSSIDDTDVIKHATDSRIPVYCVLVRSLKNYQPLARIAKLSGGKLIKSPDNEELIGLYKTIKGAQKSCYTIQYKSAVKPDNKTHNVEVRLKYDSLMDRASAEFGVKERCNIDFEMPSRSQIVFISLAILLLILIIIFVIYFIRKGIKALIAGYKKPEESAKSRDYNRVITLDEQIREYKQRIITPQDPEYVYSKAWLVQKDGPDTGKKFPIYWEEITLGRDDDNSIVIKDESVSAKHAKIKEVKGAYYLLDLASDNGTFLNSKKLLRPKPLYDWDEIKIGRTLFIFRGSKIA